MHMIISLYQDQVVMKGFPKIDLYTGEVTGDLVSACSMLIMLMLFINLGIFHKVLAARL